jgi:hypothetical protein
MAQRYAFSLLIRRTKSPTPTTVEVEMLYGSVQAADASEVGYLTSLPQLVRWLEGVLPSTPGPD